MKLHYPNKAHKANLCGQGLVNFPSRRSVRHHDGSVHSEIPWVDVDCKLCRKALGHPIPS